LIWEKMTRSKNLEGAEINCSKWGKREKRVIRTSGEKEKIARKRSKE